jgi:hypothetical protein
LPRSSYFYHRARLQVADKYVEVRLAMSDIFERNYSCYGYRRMQASLTRQSVNISEKVVRRLMKQESLVPVMRKRRRYGSYMGEISPAPDNLLNRDFSACAPNEKWLTDITEFLIPAGKVYVSPMIDASMASSLAGRLARVQMPNSSTRCWMRRSRPSPPRVPGRGAFRSWRTLPLAWLAVPDRTGELGSLNVAQGVLARQCSM